MLLRAKYRVQLDSHSALFFEPSQVPLPSDLNKIRKGEPFNYSVLNQPRDTKVPSKLWNRMVFVGEKIYPDGSYLLLMDFFTDDLGRIK